MSSPATVAAKSTVYYLELTRRENFRPKWSPRTDLVVRRAETACPEFARFLYTAVGGDCRWVRRLDWTWRQWLDLLNCTDVAIWVGYAAGVPYGYFEFARQATTSGPQLDKDGGSEVEIVQFGLVPQFRGQGLGGHLLSEAVLRAWYWGASRVWLHTCTFDHPQSMTNYRARGFELYDEQKDVEHPTCVAPLPWPAGQMGTA